MKKILIISDTFIDGKPVFAGDVLEVDDSIQLALTQAKRAVLADKATPEQKAIVKKEKK